MKQQQTGTAKTVHSSQRNFAEHQELLFFLLQPKLPNRLYFTLQGGKKKKCEEKKVGPPTYCEWMLQHHSEAQTASYFWRWSRTQDSTRKQRGGLQQKKGGRILIYSLKAQTTELYYTARRALAALLKQGCESCARRPIPYDCCDL